MSKQLCRFTMEVECSKHNECGKCGWNPDNAQRRKEKIRKERSDLIKKTYRRRRQCD